ncbi:MAG: 1-phosphofructokinase family hexose kinase [Bacteroidetes bacterium]|nr:1-phosphofructokinase family hexose kinase [Bacteroidota bacterium]HET6243729.1 1-phosphofructokinase family hexose kinase [Bacteroidia bacterium]
MIVTLTVNPALDIYTSVDQIESNKKLKCAPSRMDPGGGGINVSRVIQRLGGKSLAIYTRGGYTGKMYSELLDKENVNQDPVDVKNDLRQNFAVRETSSGNLFRFGMPGAVLEEADYQIILEKIEHYNKAEFLVVSGSLPPDAPHDFYVQVAKKARINKQKFILDTSGKALSGILEEGAYLIKPSIDELKDLTGENAEDEQEQRNLLLKVIENYDVNIIVLSLGAKGALVATQNRVDHFQAPSVESKSSIGAGDSMVAGIVFSLAQGKSLTKAVLFGLACGSATIKTPGTQLLYKQDAEQLYNELISLQLK